MIQNKNNKILYPRGSEWRKWDLHIHSPASYLWNGPKEINGSIDNVYKKLIQKINKTDIETFAITDYWTFEGYKKIIEINKKLGPREKLKKKILPGIELRFDILTDRDNKTRVNFQVIFSDESSEKEILDRLNQFYSQLRLSSTDKIISRQSFIDIAKDYSDDELEALVGKKRNGCREEDFLNAGYKSCYVSYDCINQILKSKKFEGNALVVAPWDKYGGLSYIDPILRDDIKKKLTALANIIESTKNETIKLFLLDEELLGEKTWAKSWKQFLDGKEKPCICGSDSHDLDGLGQFAYSRFCWIKADPTFEGLKQIIYEPKERVKIQKDSPEPIKSIYSIDSVKIENSVINRNLAIKEMEMPLNRNLVAVIGGKGSGKTAFLDLVANCYANKIDPLNKNSFVQRILNEGRDLNTKITFLNTEEFSKKLIEEKFIIESDIEYIPQGQIENKIGDAKNFHEFLQNLIFESSKIETSVALSEYKEIKESIRNIKGKIEKINQEIYTIETQTKSKEVEVIDRQQKLKGTERKNIENKIAILKEGFAQEKIKEIKEIAKRLSNFQKHREMLLHLRRLVEETIEKFIIFEDINKNLEEINTLIEALDLSLKKIKLFDYNTIKDQIALIKGNVNEKLLVVNKEIGRIQTKIEKLQKDRKGYIVLLDRLNDVNSEIKDLKEKRKRIEELKKILSHKTIERWNLYKSLFKNYIDLREKYKEIIEIFSRGAHDILAGIDFKASLTFDFNKFAKIGEDVLDLRTIREAKTQKVSLLESEHFKEIIDTLKQLVSSKNKRQEKAIDHLAEKIKIKIPEFIQIKKSTRTNEHLYEWLFGDYLSLNTEIYFNKIFLEKLSLGQKCTVLLKVYLAQGESPILIDQPDDNLDNEFIMNELVKAIRKAKTNRQIIIASNNANVVINSDAEQIIVAEYKKGKISYMSGSVENPIIKKYAIHILEGGQEAFESREKKYGFKHA